ncbi:unnamed protein product, partial [Tilletia laevis]
DFGLIQPQAQMIHQRFDIIVIKEHMFGLEERAGVCRPEYGPLHTLREYADGLGNEIDDGLF